MILFSRNTKCDLSGKNVDQRGLEPTVSHTPGGRLNHSDHQSTSACINFLYRSLPSKFQKRILHIAPSLYHIRVFPPVLYSRDIVYKLLFTSFVNWLKVYSLLDEKKSLLPIGWKESTVEAKTVFARRSHQRARQIQMCQFSLGSLYKD